MYNTTKITIHLLDQNSGDAAERGWPVAAMLKGTGESTSSVGGRRSHQSVGHGREFSELGQRRPLSRPWRSDSCIRLRRRHANDNRINWLYSCWRPSALVSTDGWGTERGTLRNELCKLHNVRVTTLKLRAQVTVQLLRTCIRFL